MKHLWKDCLELVDVQTGYLQDKGEKLVSKNLNLKIRQGELVALMGANGCGKSTLLYSIAGLLPLLGGSIMLHDEELQALSPRDLAKKISLVLTEDIPNKQILVRELVELGRYPYTNYYARLTAEDKACVERAVQSCHLEALLERRFFELSDGERQRVLIARALAQDTPLILLDEPMAHLDLPTRLELILMLQELVAGMNKTMLISTHEIDFAVQWFDRICLMNQDGELQVGCPEDLVLNGAFQQAFVHEGLVYDALDNSFSIESSSEKKIRLEGKAGLHYTWTKKALKRIAYTVIEDNSSDDVSDCVSLQEDESWLLLRADKSYACSCLEEVLSHLT